MSRLVENVRQLAHGAWRALPFETTHVALAAACTIIAIQDHWNAVETWLARLILGTFIATPLCFALTLAARSGRLDARARAIGSALLSLATFAAVTYGLPDVDHVGERFAWPYGLSLGAAVLLPFLAVAFTAAPASRDDDFARFVRRFLEQTTLWSLLAVAAAAAVGLVFAALHGLFDLDVDKLVGQTLVVVLALFLVAWLFRLLPTLDAAPSKVPEVWRRLVTAVGAPFVAVMLTILGAYEIYALVGDELPRNLLSPLIVGAGSTGFFCTLVILSILREPASTGGTLAPTEHNLWARTLSVRVARIFPIVLLFLLPVAGWALWLRLGQYGMTPLRVVRLYALVGLGVLALLGSLRYLRDRGALTWEVPLCCASLALLAAFGPMSAVRLSLRSQTPRLEKLLAEAGVKSRTVVAASLPEPPVTLSLDYERYHELQEQMRLIDALGGRAALAEVLEGDLTPCLDGWSNNCLRRLGVDAGELAASPGHPRYQETQVLSPFAVPPRAAEVELLELTTMAPKDSRGMTFTLTARSLKLTRRGQDLGEVALGAVLPAEGAPSLSPLALPFSASDGSVEGQLLVEKLWLRREGNDVTIESLRGLWLTLRPSNAPDVR